MGFSSLTRTWYHTGGVMDELFPSSETGGKAAFIFIRMDGGVPVVAGYGEDAVSLFRRTPEETIGRESTILFAGGEAPRFAELFARMNRSGIGVSGEFTMADATGRTFPALVAIGPCLNPDGEVTAGHGVVIDLSGKAEIEDQLRESRRELAESTLILETMFHAIPDVIGIQDDSHRIIRYNEAGYRFLGMTQEQVAGRRCFELIGRTERCEVCATTRTLETKRPARIERYEPTMDMWLDVRAYPVLDTSGNVVRVIEHLRDITPLKRSEAMLRESEEHHRLLLEGQRDVVATTDPEGRLTYCSPAVSTFGGYDPEEVIGTHISRYFVNGPEIVSGILESIISESRDGGARTFEALFIPREGDPFPVEIIPRAIIEDGAVRALHGVMRDIRERRRAEQEKQALEAQVRHSQKLESLGVLAGGIAHDFNNLLVAILGNADLALASLSNTSPAFEPLRDIDQAARRASELCMQMLAYSGRGHFVKEHIDLTGTVTDMSQILSTSISKKALLRYELGRDPATIEGDPAQIHQVVMNLIMNASESLGDGEGTIVLSAGTKRFDRDFFRNCIPPSELSAGLYCFIEVSDTGCGMDEQTMPRIFEPFFTTKFTGRGLGMSAVLGIIRSHGGAIRIVSSPGEGTTFTVVFPRAEHRSKTKKARPVGGGQRRGTGTLLVIDDEAVVLVTARRMLEKAGFTVHTAGDGRAGVEFLRGMPGEVDCVLLDLTMPSPDGEETFLEIREIDPEVPVILSSGYSGSEVARRFVGKNIAGFLQKPYRSEQLLDALRSALS